MKKWRVGTLSMGATLIFAGAALFVSQWKGMQAFDMLMAWWPAVLILLGLEIVVYTVISKREHSVVYYDVFSILFVCILGLGCLAFTFLTSTGIMQEVRLAVAGVERSVPLTETAQDVPPEVSRIVVITDGVPARVDKSESRELHLFGYYRYAAGSEENWNTSEVAKADVRVIGETLYVTMPSPPRKSGIHRVFPDMSVTLVVPKDIPVEMRGWRGQPING